MDNFKSFLLSCVIGMVSKINSYGWLFCVFISTAFLLPPAYAQQTGSFALNTIQAFLLGVSLPLFVCAIWYLFFRKTTSEPSQVLSTDELHNYTRDLTTNLPTAQHALKHFDRALKSTKGSSMAAIVFKPVNFKQVNSVLGHHNSDILLLQLAFCLQNKLVDNQHLLSFDNNPEPIRVARLQGLDFLVVFDLLNTRHEKKYVIDELCQQLAQAIPDAMSFKSFSLNFELAFGVAISGEHGSSVNEIVSHATDALLMAESTEQNLVYFDNSTVLYTEQQLALMESLQKDILAHDLRWYLQPQVNIENNHIVGFELKVHWYHEENKPLELMEFIDLAEYSGDAYQLTKQMLNQAFKSLAILHNLGVRKRVSINITSKSLLEPDLVDYVEQQMSSFNIAGKFLTIELSEQVILSACQRAKKTIDQLKSLDVEIAIDHFSGSYEALRYLRKIAINQVKIDCQQLGKSEYNRVDKAIVNALITLTRSMNIPLVGTNINKHEVVNDYIAMGGSLVQGDIISKGVVPEELEVWLKKWFAQHPEN